jgi:hypothetical protein
MRTLHKFNRRTVLPQSKAALRRLSSSRRLQPAIEITLTLQAKKHVRVTPSFERIGRNLAAGPLYRLDHVTWELARMMPSGEDADGKAAILFLASTTAGVTSTGLRSLRGQIMRDTRLICKTMQRFA